MVTMVRVRKFLVLDTLGEDNHMVKLVVKGKHKKG